MATPVNLAIPRTTLTVGAHVFGPVPLAAGYAQAAVSLDRTVTGGLNTTPATRVAVQFDRSLDGGATWQLMLADSFPGGFVIEPGGYVVGSNVDMNGNPLPIRTTQDETVSLNGQAQQVRATITVSGASVVVAGNVALT